MKWGRKTSSPPSFHGSMITRVFPGTWFSKFKQIGGSHETTSGKKQQRGKLDFSPASSSLPAGRREARFYSLDNDAYWTLSFRKDRGECRRKINPLLYESEEEFQAAVSRFESFGLKETTQLPRINEMVDTIKKKQNRGAQLKKEEKNHRRRSRKLRSRGERKKKTEFGTVIHGEKKPSSPKEEEAFPTEPEEDSDDDHAIADLDEKRSSNVSSERVSNLKCQNLGNKKFEENKVRTEIQGECAYTSRRSHSRKIKRNRKKAHAPRSECRIQALEDMKKARIKLKKEAKEQATESSTIYNSFAVVKSSFNPQQDFRDSMVEMIEVKGIRRREELEELLACYLTLNCDGHHDFIINAFQQVWFELNG